MRVRELRVSDHPIPGVPQGRTRIQTPAQAAELFRPLLAHEACEVCMIALLDAKHHLIAIHTVHRGTLDTCSVHPREVFKAALLGNASGLMTAHNHPSGDSTPSPDDLLVFARLNESGALLGVDVLDHVIIGEGEYWSTLERREPRG